MSHLACNRHKRRALIIVRDGQWHAVHRMDGKPCDSKDFNVDYARFLDAIERWAREEERPSPEQSLLKEIFEGGSDVHQA